MHHPCYSVYSPLTHVLSIPRSCHEFSRPSLPFSALEMILVLVSRPILTQILFWNLRWSRVIIFSKSNVSYSSFKFLFIWFVFLNFILRCSPRSWFGSKLLCTTQNFSNDPILYKNFYWPQKFWEFTSSPTWKIQGVLTLIRSPGTPSEVDLHVPMWHLWLNNWST